MIVIELLSGSSMCARRTSDRQVKALFQRRKSFRDRPTSAGGFGTTRDARWIAHVWLVKHFLVLEGPVIYWRKYVRMYGYAECS